MAEAFRGEFNQKVDAKARVSVPASFRRVIEAGDPKFAGGKSSFVLVYGGDRQYLECYTMTEMAKIEDQIALLPAGSKSRRYLERNMITLALNMEVDEDGRIVLPQKGRDKLGITPDEMKAGLEAVFAGTLNKFQIWKSETYAAALAAEADEDDLLPPGADMLSLLPGAGD
ncbi:division/cell wall cluster transcriptional repressor MraZ [Cereibacter ovatus]|uniref:Transcriptional regulator MraZ n=1 Tax=Cereibacter ovatus TaxID=439529 RepID=A0A285CN93_9RHOB|nr:division/cell wall cluster transcriptional repressor MraZ [Cereibacter ovatus]SNX69007.1 division/cell wall cluster transcriptional repressor MraZ [Cereibacter ovatus]